MKSGEPEKIRSLLALDVRLRARCIFRFEFHDSPPLVFNFNYFCFSVFSFVDARLSGICEILVRVFIFFPSTLFLKLRHAKTKVMLEFLVLGFTVRLSCFPNAMQD